MALDNRVLAVLAVLAVVCLFILYQQNDPRPTQALCPACVSHCPEAPACVSHCPEAPACVSNCRKASSVSGFFGEDELPPLDLQHVPPVKDLRNMPATDLPEEHANIYYQMLRRTLLASCPGTLCDFSTTGTPGQLFEQQHKKFQCRPLIANALAGVPAWIWPPKKQIPPPFLDDFTMGGKYPHLSTLMYMQRQGGVTPQSLKVPVTGWTSEIVEHWISRVPTDRSDRKAWQRQWDAKGNYGYSDAKCLYDAVSVADPALSVRGKHIAVVGSILPWVEGIMIAAGVAHVTTIEYGSIECDHPKISTITPLELTQAINMGKALPQFDGIVSYSSLEHSGMGRYGDELNPWGDIMAVAQVWCMTKPGGFLHMALPMSADVGGKGREGFVFNRDRIYGKNRLPHVLANWEYRKQTCRGATQPTISLVKVDQEA